MAWHQFWPISLLNQLYATRWPCFSANFHGFEGLLVQVHQLYAPRWGKKARRKLYTNKKTFCMKNPEPSLWGWPAASADFTEPGLWNLCVARRKFQTNSPELTLWNWPAAGAIFKMSLAEPGLWNFCVARRKFQTMGHCQVRVHLLAQQQLSSLHICQQSA